MRAWVLALLGSAILLAGTYGGLCAAESDAAARHRAVLEMKPAGYWPGDEGRGDVLHDLSGNENHGLLHHVDWEKNQLDFRGLYQWIEIPDHPHYQGKAFSLGGWVFTRGEIYGGRYAGRTGMLFFGNAYHTSGYTLDTLYDDAVLFGKSRWTVAGGTEQGINLCLRWDQLVDVISGGRRDALGSRADEIAIATGQWQHILYTYEAGARIEGGDIWRSTLDRSVYDGAGTAKLYLNGELVASADAVPFERRDQGFLVGSDAVWWLQSDRSGSLDGSVRDLVMFDRALTAAEVAQLCSTTQPNVEPVVYDEDIIIIESRAVAWSELAGLSPADCRLALEQLEERDAELLRGRADELMPVLIAAVRNWETCRAASAILVKIGDADAQAALDDAISVCVRALETPAAPEGAKVEAALALAEMRGGAGAAITVLIESLNDIDKREPAHVPRIEDLLRNAVLRALLNIAPQDDRVRSVVGTALARPVLETLALADAGLAEVRMLIEAGRYMDALDVYRTRPNDQRPSYFSYGDARRDHRGNIHDHAYTAVAERDGWIYTLGDGKGFQAVESIAPEEFHRQVDQLAAEYPTAKTWRDANAPHLYRAKITKRGLDGQVQTAYLEGEWFVFDGTDAKVRGWSIAVDNDGYLHITGGKHNVANPDAYIPGSWERMGASREYTNDDFPAQLYWVSRQPGDITSLEFVGQRRNPRNVPVPDGLNYMNFVQDRNGELYLYGRVHVQGVQSWGLYHYDTQMRRWNAVGGFPPDVTAEFPDWSDWHIRMTCDSLALATMRWDNNDPRCRVLAWARQPHFYNYCRSMWGVKFDRTNRMHVQVPLFGIDAENRNVNLELYAYSDDGGQTFHRADGTELALPLTSNPGPGHAAMRANDTKRWWRLWHSLLHEAGY